MTTYTPTWFESQVDHSRSSAAVVVPALVSMLKPRSVVDVGCGQGAWAAAFLGAGVADVLGIDGEYVDRSRLLIPADRFLARDLSRPLELGGGRRFDLCVCLEVAEHLPGEHAPALVDALCGLAPTVVFSAAVPGQGGNHHVNERFLSEWVALFAARGYAPIDAVRPLIWGDERVAWWYRQNMILLAGPGSSARASAERPGPTMIDVIHPELYKRELRRSARPFRALCSDALGVARAVFAGASRS
jgi:SAM-dependent methyltransferase